jgi:hypothetical protein
MRIGWLLMSRERHNWFGWCLFLTLIVGTFIAVFVTPFAVLFIVFALLVVGVAYILVTEKPRISASPRTSRKSDTKVQPSEDSQKLAPEPELVQVRVLDSDTTELQPLPAPSPQKSPLTKKESTKSETKLRQNIEKLEKRVLSLQKQLAEDPSASLEVIPSPDEVDETISSEFPVEDLELSALAIDRLLEALDEKLAKGSIPKPLYDRLRDKYIARREKAKKRHKAPSKRGTKEQLTGE